jgi:hypothetical protein
VAGLAQEHAETVRPSVGRGSTFQQVLARISDSDLFARPILIIIVRTSVLSWRSNYASAVSKPTSCSILVLRLRFPLCLQPSVIAMPLCSCWQLISPR